MDNEEKKCMESWIFGFINIINGAIEITDHYREQVGELLEDYSSGSALFNLASHSFFLEKNLLILAEEIKKYHNRCIDLIPIPEMVQELKNDLQKRYQQKLTEQ